MLEESGVGLIVTEGSPNSSVDNSLVGVDFSFRNTRLQGGRVVETHVWNQQSSTGGLSGEDRAYGIAVRSPNSTGFAGGVDYTRLEENFNPELGFVNRTGIEGIAAGIDYRHRPSAGLLRSVLFGVDAERIDLIATGALESEEIDFRLLELESRHGDELQLRRANNREVLIEPFEVSPGVIIPIGDYSFADTSIEISSADQRKLWGSIDYTTGEFYDGDRLGIEASVSWRPSGRFLTALGYEFNDIDLPYGSFVTRLASFRADVVFSPKLSWVTLLQYDNVSEIMGINLRLHWVPEPGQDGYIVINHNLDDPDRDDDFHSLSTEAAVKFSYTFRF